MKTSVIRGGLAAVAWLSLGVGCGSDFEECRESRTCVSAPGGGGDSDPGQVDGGAGSGTAGAAGGGDREDRGDRGDAGSEASPGSGGQGGDEGGRAAAAAGAGGTADDAPIPADTTPPSVVSISPSDGTKGVAADAVIVVIWSEPMNKVSAQASFQSLELSGKVLFDWNADGTVMTLKPTTPLEYASGEHAKLASAAAKTYNLSLNTAATDLAGNALPASHAWAFSTLRRIALNLIASSDRVVQLAGNGSVASLDSDIGIYVGDRADDARSRFAVDFDIAGLPVAATGIALARLKLPMTMLSASTGAAVGQPFVGLGALVVDHVYAANIKNQSPLWTTLSAVGTLADKAAEGVREIDITKALADDFAHRAERQNRSQYRAQFSSVTDSDEQADGVYICYDSLPTLALEYLIP